MSHKHHYLSEPQVIFSLSVKGVFSDVELKKDTRILFQLNGQKPLLI